MAVTRIATSSLKSLNKYDSFLGGNAYYVPPSFESVATTTVGAGGSSTVSFSSIPSTYKHLQIRGLSRATAGGIGAFFIQFNSDTGTNYADHRIEGNGATAYTDRNTSAIRALSGLQAGSTTGANIFGGSVVDVLDYQNTSKYKTIRALSGIDNNGSGNIAFGSGLWMSTSAVTSITLIPENTAFAQYSSFALYGIKA